MAKDYDKEDGVWRTIGGRKVFIRKGQNLADAMIESGKFKGQKNKPGMRESYRKEKEKDYKEQKDLAKKFQESETDKDYYAFLNKVEDNGEKYEKTLEEREKEKQRNDEIDKQRGTEPLREKYREEKEIEKTIHTQSGSYTPKEIEQRDNEIKNLYKSTWNGDMTYKELNDKLEDLRKDGKVSYGELSSLQYDASREYDKELDKPKTSSKSSNEEARKDAFDYSREEVTKAYETMRDKMQKHMNNNEDHWSGKEYTNAEFLAHLEDANWHGEMKQLREANLTPEQLTEIKDKTTLSSWGVGSELTGKENVQKMIDSVKNKSTNEEQERLDIARDIAKELYQLNDKNSTQEKIDKYARDIMEYTDGEVITNEEPYKDKNGNIQRSTQSLRDWREELNKTKEPKTTNETMNNTIREKASKSNTIPRDYEKIVYTQKIDTNAGKKGDKFELYKNEYGETETKNLRTGETYQANMSMMKSPEAVEFNEIIRKQANVKNAYKQYLKEHPESKMSLSQFKNMNK